MGCTKTGVLTDGADEKTAKVPSTGTLSEQNPVRRQIRSAWTILIMIWWPCSGKDNVSDCIGLENECVEH